jgi:uncharacterized protein (DUF169 family)
MIHTRKATSDLDFDREEFKNNRARFIQIYGPNAPPAAIKFVYEKKKHLTKDNKPSSPQRQTQNAVPKVSSLSQVP